MRLIILILLLVLLLRDNGRATSVILPTWEESAVTSEFIGVVECVVAGGIVARYRVVDSWKGVPVGTEFNMSQSVDGVGPQFPTSLVGERSFVFADEVPSNHSSPFSSGGSVPLWWRNIPTDFRCYHVVPIVEPTGTLLYSPVGSRNTGLAQFKAEVTDFLKLDSESQEMRFMLATARSRLQLPNPGAPDSLGDEEDGRLYEWLSGAKDVGQLWQRILERAARLNPPLVLTTADEVRAERHKSTLLLMISHGGRERCKALLDQADVTTLPWEKKEMEYASGWIGRNLWLARGAIQPQKVTIEKPVTARDIEQAEAALVRPWDAESAEAFELLCRHSPGSLVPFLSGIEASKAVASAPFGYTVGARFGHLCSSDRVTHLRSLLSAKDEWIRVSAAVYLCFDDAKQGKEALNKFLELEGDAGAWAAIVLASRGEKAAMPRALEVMATPCDQGRLTMNHYNLQSRLRVLLSNAASASGVGQPPDLPRGSFDGPELRMLHHQWHASLSRWWEMNQQHIELSDPWSKWLEVQKVD